MNILTKDFVEFIECCVARDVWFLIVGGLYPDMGEWPFGGRSGVWIYEQ